MAAASKRPRLFSPSNDNIGSPCSLLACSGICDLSEKVLQIQLGLSKDLAGLTFSSPVFCVYDPVTYAGQIYSQFIRRFCRSSKPVLMLGMNPGPWGMAQTGVPFGEVNVVKNWLRLDGTVTSPDNEHPARPISGLNCQRSEVSGKKLWGLLKELSGETVEPEIALSQVFLHNLCPLLFLSQKGTNITPAEIKVAERRELLRICESALKLTCEVLGCSVVLAVGKFAEQRAHSALSTDLPHIKIFSIPHPSPRNVSCRKNWASIATEKITSLGLLPYFQHEEEDDRGDGPGA